MVREARGRWSDEGGALTAEYVATIIVVGLVVAALVAAALPTTIGDWGRYAVCSLFGDDCERPEQALTDEDFRPESCDIMTTTFSGEVGVDILVFDVGGGLSVTRTDASDGRTTFTVLDTSDAGISGEVGAELHGGFGSAEAMAEARVGLLSETAHQYVRPTSEADDFEQTLHQRAALDAGGRRMPVVGGMLDWVSDRTIGELGDPDKTFIAVGADASTEASAGVSAFGEQLAGTSLALEGAVLVGHEKDRTPGETPTDTAVYRVEWDASAELSFLAGKAEAGATAESTMSVVRDLDGELMRIEFESSYAADSDVSFGANLEEVQTLLASGQDRTLTQRAVLELPETEDRRVVEDWLETGRNEDELARMTQERGELSYLVYEGEETGLTLGGKVALGVKLGLEGSGSRASSRLVDARYAGVPQSDGTRRLVPNYDCLTGSGSW